MYRLQHPQARNFFICGPALKNAVILFAESNIHRHQSLYETMCQAYTEVHSNSKKLLYQLDHLVQVNNQTKEATANHVSEESRNT